VLIGNDRIPRRSLVEILSFLEPYKQKEQGLILTALRLDEQLLSRV
jgi:hypothetical protein